MIFMISTYKFSNPQSQSIFFFHYENVIYLSKFVNEIFKKSHNIKRFIKVLQFWPQGEKKNKLEKKMFYSYMYLSSLNASSPQSTLQKKSRLYILNIVKRLNQCGNTKTLSFFSHIYLHLLKCFLILTCNELCTSHTLIASWINGCKH